MATVKKNLIIGRDGLTIGKRVRQMRERAGFSIAGLADRARMDAQTLRKIEEDGSTAPSFINALRLATALSASPFLMAGEPEPALQEVEAESYNTRVSTPRVLPDAEMAALPQAVGTLERKLAETDDKLALAIEAIQRLEVQLRPRATRSKQA